VLRDTATEAMVKATGMGVSGNGEAQGVASKCGGGQALKGADAGDRNGDRKVV
jgi:hypothetical protein